MPITEFLDGVKFNRETTRVSGVAYEMACTALKFADQTYLAHETIAKCIIELAKDGVLDPDRLCERALDEVRKTVPRTPVFSNADLLR
jgi:hypothetical protein